jgi:hypothetical protein
MPIASRWNRNQRIRCDSDGGGELLDTPWGGNKKSAGFNTSTQKICNIFTDSAIFSAHNRAKNRVNPATTPDRSPGWRGLFGPLPNNKIEADQGGPSKPGSNSGAQSPTPFPPIRPIPPWFVLSPSDRIINYCPAGKLSLHLMRSSLGYLGYSTLSDTFWSFGNRAKFLVAPIKCPCQCD